MEKDETQLAYERAMAASRRLREVFDSESHSTPEGNQAIQKALDEFNEAATALTVAWNRQNGDRGDG